MVADPQVGEVLLIMKGSGENGTVLGLWPDEDTGIEWVILRRHTWSDEAGAWTPTEKLVPLICEPESLLRREPASVVV